MKILLVIGVILTNIIPSFAQGIENRYFSGINKQTITDEYPVEIKIDKLETGKISGTIFYRSFGCGGNLIFIGKTYDNRFFFKEQLTENPSNCVENGTVSLQVLDENNLVFYWYYSNGSLGSATVMNQDSYTNEQLGCDNPIKIFNTFSDVYEIPVELNNTVKISFIFDTGASEVTLTPDVAAVLVRSGTVTENDWLEGKIYRFADGSTAKSERFIIRKLTIGNYVLENVSAAISNSMEAPLLLGQNAMKQLGKISIDYDNNVLCVE